MREHGGYFAQAHGGTLFLDEVADAPPDVQAMLLRVLETGELQRVGSPTSRKVDVRLVAATDADLERAVEDERFRLPLLHRLAGYQLRLPPLRDRRDDLMRLLVHFLRGELEAEDATHRLADSDRPWLTAELASRLLAHRWPGNVRELRNAARHLVISCGHSDRATLDDVLRRQLQVRAPAPDVAASIPQPTPDELDEEKLLHVLRRHRWRPSRAARELGISRTTIYRLIDQSSRIRKAADLTRTDLQAAANACGGDLDRMVEQLEVSKRGIQLRMKDLGM